MSLERVPAGNNLPEEFNVIIEIPMNADPVKYEVDKDSGSVFVDRFMLTAMHYPCNYGHIPQTISDHCNPVDVLVLASFPTQVHAIASCWDSVCVRVDLDRGRDLTTKQS